MQLLILGGTAWLGGYLATTALQHGHHVTCLARGASGIVPSGAAFIRADRTNPNAYDGLCNTTWDAVIDLATQPGQVRDATTAFGPARLFVFISSCSAYADHAALHQTESAALLPALQTDIMESLQTFGEAKVACEQHVLKQFGPTRSLIVRPGLIGGPGDITHRTGYWPLRFARPSNPEARVLTPDTPDFATQIIDVRDLASWIIECVMRGQTGIYNATGDILPFHDHLSLARSVANHTGAIVARSSSWLLDHKVNPWMGPRSLPLWIPMPEYAGFGARDSSAARSNGLSTRPIKETLADTLAWELKANLPEPRPAGLSYHDERLLLDQ